MSQKISIPFLENSIIFEFNEKNFSMNNLDYFISEYLDALKDYSKDYLFILKLKKLKINYICDLNIKIKNSQKTFYSKIIKSKDPQALAIKCLKESLKLIRINTEKEFQNAGLIRIKLPYTARTSNKVQFFT